MASDKRQGAGESTNVRLTMLGLRLLARWAPGLCAAFVERLFFKPPRTRPSKNARTARGGRPFRLRGNGRRIAGFRWGRGPSILLLHGWGGRSEQLSAFVAPLRSRGFSVVAFDAPGHGRSARGLSSAPEFARALRAVADMAGPVHAVVAHSLGAVAAALAIADGLPVSRVVLLAPPANPPDWFFVLAARLRIPAGVCERVRARSERRLGIDWERLRMPALVGEFQKPALVIHDRHDAEVRLEDGAAVAAAWPRARLLETEGLGHNRILRDPAVVAEAVAFLAEDAVCECGGHPLGACAAYLEQQLFDRDSRHEEWGASPA